MSTNEDRLFRRRVGRPRIHPMPDPIPDTPENVARILMTTKPKRYDEWEYLKNQPKPDKDRRQSEE